MPCSGFFGGTSGTLTVNYCAKKSSVISCGILHCTMMLPCASDPPSPPLTMPLPAAVNWLSLLQEATFVLTEKGIKIVVDQAKSLQAKVFLQAGLFSEYRCVAPRLPLLHAACCCMSLRVMLALRCLLLPMYQILCRHTSSKPRHHGLSRMPLAHPCTTDLKQTRSKKASIST